MALAFFHLFLPLAILLALPIGLLGWLQTKIPKSNPDTLTQAVLAVLPRIDCGQCGYPGCLPYTQAMLAGGAKTNLCAPGGQPTAIALTNLLGQDLPTTLSKPTYQLASIQVSSCIGCGLCLPVCPTDAILGAPKRVHAVLEKYCTGCELCVPACPVDCITMFNRIQLNN